MEHYVGLDVSLKQTSICVVNQVGSVVREGVVDSEPEAIAEIDWTGRISKCGDAMLRSDLFEAAGVLLTRVPKWSARSLRPRNYSFRRLVSVLPHSFAHEVDMISQHVQHARIGGRHSEMVCLFLQAIKPRS